MSRTADKLSDTMGYVFPNDQQNMETGITSALDPKPQQQERIAYTVHEAAQMLGVHYFSVYWLIQQKKIHACRGIPGKILIPRSELERFLENA